MSKERPCDRVHVHGHVGHARPEFDERTRGAMPSVPRRARHATDRERLSRNGRVEAGIFLDRIRGTGPLALPEESRLWVS